MTRLLRCPADAAAAPAIGAATPWPVRSRAALVVALTVTLVGASCSGDDTATPSTTAPEVESVPAEVELALDVTRAVVVSDGAAQADLADPTRADVVGVVTRFLQATAVDPMTTGEPATGVEELLTEEAAARLAGDDRRALVDEGITASDEVEVGRAEMELSALATGSDPQLVVARFALDLEGSGGVGVQRRGELTLVPIEGSWRISAYEVVVDRSSAEPTPTSSTTEEP